MVSLKEFHASLLRARGPEGLLVELGFVQQEMLTCSFGSLVWAALAIEERDGRLWPGCLFIALGCLMRWYFIASRLALARATMINGQVLDWKTQNVFIAFWCNTQLPAVLFGALVGWSTWHLWGG